MAAKSDYYDILGVTKSASGDELKKAYRKQAMEWHPDRHKGSDKEAAEKRFKEINEAYQVLSDSSKKAAYDQYGHAAFSPGGGFSGARGGGNPFAGGGQGGQWGPFTYTYSSGGQGSSPFEGTDFGDPFDIFESFFGGGMRGASRQRAMSRYSMTIDFMDAINGVEKEVSVEGKKKKIKIPAGIDEGQSIRFEDFILSVNIRPHKIFERDGSDIYVNLDVPFTLAVLGGEVEVPTVEEDIKIRIRAGTQPGTMVRLKGKGAPSIHGRGRGDEYVKINVVVPEKLSRDQKRLIENLQTEGL